MTEQAIYALIADADFEHFGLRVHHQSAAVGDVLAPSFVWVDGNQTDDQLPGTCAIRINAQGAESSVRASISKALAMIGSYNGKSVVLVASQDVAHRDIERNDINEEIMIDATVLAVIR